MRLRAASVAAVIAITGSTAAHSQEASQQAGSVFRAGADAVSVDVSVQRDRRPVIGLKAADFELLDNGVPQEITEVAYERLPIDVTLLLDVSASVTGDVLDELRRALRQVRGDLAPGDRLRLITFNMRVRRLVDFTEPASTIDTALASLGGAGSSAVLDALAVALSSADAPGRRRLVVLFSDGQDSSSITDAESLVDIARRSTPTVAIVLSSPHVDRPASLIRSGAGPSAVTVRTLSERIAAETGGVVTTVGRGESLSAGFRRTLQDFRTSYVLYFIPRGVERVGPHALAVRVKRPGVNVRARRGYIWR